VTEDVPVDTGEVQGPLTARDQLNFDLLTGILTNGIGKATVNGLEVEVRFD
jgi:hypothetical protein